MLAFYHIVFFEIVESDWIKQQYKFPIVAVRQRSMKQEFTQGDRS